jgi:hypothetical protein
MRGKKINKITNMGNIQFFNNNNWKNLKIFLKIIIIFIIILNKIYLNHSYKVVYRG